MSATKKPIRFRKAQDPDPYPATWAGFPCTLRELAEIEAARRNGNEDAAQEIIRTIEART